MIENERQYETTKAQLSLLEASLEKAQIEITSSKDVPEMVRQGHMNGLQMLIEDLRSELEDYETAHAHAVKAA